MLFKAGRKDDVGGAPAHASKDRKEQSEQQTADHNQGCELDGQHHFSERRPSACLNRRVTLSAVESFDVEITLEGTFALQIPCDDHDSRWRAVFEAIEQVTIHLKTRPRK